MHIICNFEALHKIFIPCLDVAATFVITFLFLLIINQTCRGDCFFCSLGKNICNKTIFLQSPSDSSPAHQTPNYEENSHKKMHKILFCGSFQGLLQAYHLTLALHKLQSSIWVVFMTDNSIITLYQCSSGSPHFPARGCLQLSGQQYCLCSCHDSLTQAANFGVKAMTAFHWKLTYLLC